MDFEDKAQIKLFEEMYNHYHMILRRLAYKYGIPSDEIEDVVHDTFLAYARSNYSVELCSDEMKKLLGRILKNKCIDYYRNLKRHGCASVEDEWYTRDEVYTDRREEPLLNSIVSKERCYALIREIEKFPKNWYDVTVLKLIQGRPTSEVCELLDISGKACYSRVGRIRKHLEKFLKEDD